MTNHTVATYPTMAEGADDSLPPEVLAGVSGPAAPRRQTNGGEAASGSASPLRAVAGRLFALQWEKRWDNLYTPGP